MQAYGHEGLGILTVAGVPAFAELREKLLPLAAEFVVRSHMPHGAVCIQPSRWILLRPRMSNGLSHICWAVFVQSQHTRDASTLSCSYPWRCLSMSLTSCMQALPENVRESYTDPASRYSFGWSHGKVSESHLHLHKPYLHT